MFLCYLIYLGAPTTPNRHDIESVFLPKVDEFVVEILISLLTETLSVSITSDGWSDRRRRNWLGFSLNYINADWKIVSLQPDLIPVSARSTAENLFIALNGAIEYWIPTSCLKATQTTDGASNERKASKLHVGESNCIHCCCHTLELVIGDVLDDDKANLRTHPHRLLLRKLHDLVVLVRSRQLLANLFADLVKEKNGDRKFEELVMDNGTPSFFLFSSPFLLFIVTDTRWDSDLTLLEHCLYFDNEILALCRNPDSNLDEVSLLTSDEFDLARVMLEVLLKFRVFSKFCQNKHSPT